MNDDIKTDRAVKVAEKQPKQSTTKENNLKSTDPTPSSVKPTKKPMLLLAAPKKVHWWLKNLTKKQKIAALAAAVVVIGSVGFAMASVLRQEPKVAYVPIIEEKEPEPPKPTTVPSRMTGVQIAPELNDLPTTGVMIENSPDARPQAGIAGADAIYEAIAEGGITRFLVLYQESQPDHIGPVRSVRPYYLDFLVPYDAAIAHAGGSAQGLAEIRNQGIKDIDHGANGSTFSRVSNRFAPHNLYTSRARLLEAHDKRGYKTSTYTGLARKEADTPVATPNARTIDFTISSTLYNPKFEYDQTSNSYKRSMAGKPHTDEKSGAQISPKVVVGLVTSHHYAGIYSVYGVNGSGKVYVFQDGTVIEGTWEKPDRKSQYTLKDAAGQIIKLNPGQTWYTLITGPEKVKITP